MPNNNGHFSVDKQTLTLCSQRFLGSQTPITEVQAGADSSQRHHS